jgi:hypothetical protein
VVAWVRLNATFLDAHAMRCTEACEAIAATRMLHEPMLSVTLPARIVAALTGVAGAVC